MTPQSSLLPSASLSTGDVARLTGASFRQLDYWVRCGYLHVDSAGSGNARRWTRADVVEAFTLARVAELIADLRVAAGVAHLARDAYERNDLHGRAVIVYGDGDLVLARRSEIVPALMAEPLALLAHLPTLIAPALEPVQADPRATALQPA